ncbi:MAG: CpaF family protein [Gemmatimonadales bacterium]|jgi:pilus assembly protein CpaF
MGLRERLGLDVPKHTEASGPTSGGKRPGNGRTQPSTQLNPTIGRRTQGDKLTALERIKLELHRKVIEQLDLDELNRIEDEALLRDQVRSAVMELLAAEDVELTGVQRDRITEGIFYEISGLGPLEPLFRDPDITDILVNGPHQVYIERKGRLSLTDIHFRDDDHVKVIIDRIVSRIGRRVDESSPMVDARLPDGSRVNAIIPPLALDGPMVSIRRFGARPLLIEDLLANASITQPMAYLLEGCVQAKLNVLISGGTGSGKTTLLNSLSRFIGMRERTVTIEDAAELVLQQEHVVRLETRPPNAEGRGEVVMRDLVKNALRMRPDRIIVGEVRGAEALDMLQAMNTGHEGSLTTIHSNSPRDALSRLETMILMAGTNLPDRAMREQIASALDLVVQVSRLSDGSRRVTSITEIVGMEGEIVTMQEIYQFERLGVAPDGGVIGRFRPTGVRPVFAHKLEISGVEIPSDMFDQSAYYMVQPPAQDDPDESFRETEADELVGIEQ